MNTSTSHPANPLAFAYSRVAALVCLTMWFFGMRAQAIPQETALRFTDMTRDCGVHFHHDDGSVGTYHIIEAMSAGLALFDFDNDGDVDIYFLNGARMDETRESPPRNCLYRNDGNWHFTDVTEMAGVGDMSASLGVAVGDYDNDGDSDVYVNNYGPNVLYRNNGDGTFTSIGEQAGVGNGNRVGAGVCFVDVDGDGDLDLYVANYVKFSPKLHVPRTQHGFSVYGSPVDYQPDADTLFRNNGDGTFTDVGLESGIARKPTPSMGVIGADYDRDGDTDIFVANDGMPNSLYRNNGHGKFQEIGLVGGFAYDGSGKVHASMGVDSADYDNDGFLDFHVTSFQAELATLYHNRRGRMLDDVTHATGAGNGTRAPVTWGNVFADFDLDGDRDLCIACGHLNDQIEKFDHTSAYLAPNILLENDGTGHFRNVSLSAGSGMLTALSSRGLAADDLDQDGDSDLVVLNSRREPTLLRNDTAKGNHWVQLRLHGTVSNRDGVGARVVLTADGQTWVDEVHAGRGYQSHFGTTLHFGLGKRTRVDSLRVYWVGGRVNDYGDIPIDRLSDIFERDSAENSP